MLRIIVRRIAILLTLGSVLVPCTTLRAADETPAFYVHATLSVPAPHMLMTEVLGFNIAQDPNGVLPIDSAEVCVVWHFGAAPLEPECNTTDNHGNVPFFRTIERMRPGESVQIEVTVDIGDGPEAIEPLIITPR